MIEDPLNLPAIIKPDAPPVYTPDTINNLFLRKPGKKIKGTDKLTLGAIRNCSENVLIVLRHSERYAGYFRYSHLMKSNRLVKKPVWDTADPFIERDITKHDITYLKANLERFGLFCARGTITDCLNLVCHENSIGDPEDSNIEFKDAVIRIIERDPLTHSRLIAKELNLDPRSQKDVSMIAETLREVGYTGKATRINGRVARVWTKTIDAKFTEVKTESADPSAVH